MQGDVTINAGKRNSDWTCRYYLKDYDSINDVSYAKLLQEKWRARFENTPQGSEVLFNSIDGWHKCSFEKVLADRFALVVPERSLFFATNKAIAEGVIEGSQRPREFCQ